MTGITTIEDLTLKPRLDDVTPEKAHTLCDADLSAQKDRYRRTADALAMYTTGAVLEQGASAHVEMTAAEALRVHRSWEVLQHERERRSGIRTFGNFRRVVAEAGVSL